MKTAMSIITPQELAELCEKGKKIDLIDVRTPVEFMSKSLETSHWTNLMPWR